MEISNCAHLYTFVYADAESQDMYCTSDQNETMALKLHRMSGQTAVTSVKG